MIESLSCFVGNGLFQFHVEIHVVREGVSCLVREEGVDVGFSGARFGERNGCSSVEAGDARVLDNFHAKGFVVIDHGEHERVLVSLAADPRGGFPRDGKHACRGFLLLHPERNLKGSRYQRQQSEISHGVIRVVRFA